MDPSAMLSNMSLPARLTKLRMWEFPVNALVRYSVIVESFKLCPLRREMSTAGSRLMVSQPPSRPIG
jgi:hypothetical protein